MHADASMKSILVWHIYKKVFRAHFCTKMYLKMQFVGILEMFLYDDALV